MKSVDPDVPLFDVKTMDQRLDEALLRPKVYSGTLVFFAAFRDGRPRRTGHHSRQPSKNHALARANSCRRALFPGILGAVSAGRFAQTLIDGTIPAEVGFSTFASLLIAAIAACAIWIATRRIARLDVMEILRTD